MNYLANQNGFAKYTFLKGLFVRDQLQASR